MKLWAILASGLLLQACATITSGTSSSIAVMTDPPGATCQLRRDGQVIAVVNPTPGTATVSKSVRPLAVDCTHPRGQPGASVVQPEFQAMTLGNVLIGGLVGLAVDAASGAMGTYPSNVTVFLAPERFENGALRDSFYQARASEVRQRYADRIIVVRQTCTPIPGSPRPCGEQITQIETERDAELQRLEQRRLSAPLIGT